MPRPRAVLLMVPPLLADVIRHVLSTRAAGLIITELPDPTTAYADLRTLDPEVVIIGPAGAKLVDSSLVRMAMPYARVLVLSADLTQLLGPGDNDTDTFTPDSLAERLRG